MKKKLTLLGLEMTKDQKKDLEIGIFNLLNSLEDHNDDMIPVTYVDLEEIWNKFFDKNYIPNRDKYANKIKNTIILKAMYKNEDTIIPLVRDLSNAFENYNEEMIPILYEQLQNSCRQFRDFEIIKEQILNKENNIIERSIKFIKNLFHDRNVENSIKIIDIHSSIGVIFRNYQHSNLIEEEIEQLKKYRQELSVYFKNIKHKKCKKIVEKAYSCSISDIDMMIENY